MHRRIQQPLKVIRPQLDSRQRWTLSTSVLSVIGSIVDHRAKLPAGRIKALLAELVAAILPVALPSLADDVDPVAAVTLSPASKYEALLNESMRLFSQKGYRDTSVEDIAAAVGMPASAEMSAVVNTVADREDALTQLIDDYVVRSFAHPELDYVYYSERLNMSAADQEILRNLQRSTVESWVGLVLAVRPEWDVGQARFAVYAAMALVIDLGRLMQYRNSAHSRATVARLMDLTLLGRYRLRTALPAK